MGTEVAANGPADADAAVGDGEVEAIVADKGMTADKDADLGFRVSNGVPVHFKHLLPESLDHLFGHGGNIITG